MNVLTIKKTIYIIDDDINIAKYHAIILSSYFNINCEVFDNPCKVYNEIYINREDIAGIILDVFMPVDECEINTGTILIQKLKKDKINIPVLFCTSLDGVKEKTKIMQDGFYCKKPLENNIKEQNSGFYLFLNKILQNQI